MMTILFACTHNRCRSIICEAVGRSLGQGRLDVVSAGSQPAGQVHPLSLRHLEEAGYPVTGLASKSWDAFADRGVDLVVTVCDSAAGESCPLWMGDTPKLHWPLADPSKLAADEETVARAFRATIAEVEDRFRALLALPLEELDPAGLARALQRLGAA